MAHEAITVGRRRDSGKDRILEKGQNRRGKYVQDVGESVEDGAQRDVRRGTKGRAGFKILESKPIASAASTC
jgi:hypothetical protein